MCAHKALLIQRSGLLAWHSERLPSQAHVPAKHSSVPMALELWLVFSHTAIATPPTSATSDAASCLLGRLSSNTTAAMAVTTGIADLRSGKRRGG